MYTILTRERSDEYMMLIIKINVTKILLRKNETIKTYYHRNKYNHSYIIINIMLLNVSEL